MKDADVSLREALPVGDHAVEEVVVQRERGDGGQQPAVPCGHTSRFFMSHGKKEKRQDAIFRLDAARVVLLPRRTEIKSRISAMYVPRDQSNQRLLFSYPDVFPVILAY